MAQLVGHPTLNLGSGLDFRVVSSGPMLGVEPTLKKKKKVALSVCADGARCACYGRKRVM